MVDTHTLTTCYRFDEVDFEPELQLLVWPNHTHTELTAIEARILSTLCYHAGQVVSVETLYNKVFVDIDREGMSAVNYDINIHLRALNDKLTINNKRAISIETIPNFGFRVSLPNQTCRIPPIVTEQDSEKHQVPERQSKTTIELSQIQLQQKTTKAKPYTLYYVAISIILLSGIGLLAVNQLL